MSSIEDFLLARMTEDESAVESLPEPMRSRLIATFDAARRVIAMRLNAIRALPRGAAVPPYDAALWDVLTILALPYAAHPDYSTAFQPTGAADVDPQPNRSLSATAMAGTLGASEVQQRAYLEVAVALAQAVAAHDPTTAEEWVDTSIGVVGTAWHTEQSTELILSRALLAMTRLAVAAAKLIGDGQTRGVSGGGDVSDVLASIPDRSS